MAEALSERFNPTAAYAAYEDEHWWYVARRRIVFAMLRTLVRPSKDAVVVDVGCGPGANLGSLAEDYRCVGIDISPEAVAIASARYPNCRFVSGLAPDDVREDLAQASAVLLMDVLEHVDGDREMLSAVVDATAPGTIVLVTVPADPSLWSGHDVAAGHVRRYTASSLDALFEGLPLERLYSSAFNSRLYPAIKAIRVGNRILRRSQGSKDSLGTDLRLPPRFLNNVLISLFGGESARLLSGMARGSSAYRRGVSLVSILRRT